MKITYKMNKIPALNLNWYLKMRTNWKPNVNKKSKIKK